MSTTSRILAGFLAVLAAALLMLMPRLLGRVERQCLEAAEEPMVDAANILAAVVGQHADASGALDLSTIRRAMEDARARRFEALIYEHVKTSVDMHMLVADRAGVVIFDSDGARAEGQDYRRMREVALTLTGAYGARATRSDPNDERTTTMFVAAPVRLAGEIAGVLSVSKPTSAFFDFIDGTRAWMGGLSFSMFGVVAAGAAVIVFMFSRPIRRLTAYAHAVTRGERIAAPHFDAPEAAALARAFEEMRDTLEGRAYVETYVQSLTHEMKSPVAAIRGAAELLREEMPREPRERFLANIEAEARRLQSIIDRLLALAAIEARKTLDHAETVALGEVAESVRQQLQVAAEARLLTLRVDSPGHALVSGEPFLIEMALANLVQNAIDFSPPGTAVTIRTALAPGGAHAELIVDDTGPGIPSYALPRIFDRFYSLQRPATGRKSSGLGLCFVREAALLHGGDAAVENREGGGVRATIRLPRRTGDRTI